MSIYFIPAFVSLALKLVVLILATKSKRHSTLFISLIVIFALHNAIELIGYLRLINGHNVDMLCRAYYAVTVFLCLFLALFGLSSYRPLKNLGLILMVLLATTLSASILFTDLIILGYESTAYAITAITGDFFALVIIYFLLTTFAALTGLVLSYRYSESQLASIRSLYSLIATLTVILAFTTAALFKVIEIGINAAAIVPLATTLFLLITLYSESKHKLTDIRRFLPYSLENRASNQFLELIDNYVQTENREAAYKNLREEIEKEIIFYSLEKCNNNISQASKMMGLKNASTLYSMMNRLSIDIKEPRQNPNIEN